VAAGNSLSVWDTRSMQCAQTIEGAHALQVRDVDYNPRRPHVLCTAGDDCKAGRSLRTITRPMLDLLLLLRASV